MKCWTECCNKVAEVQVFNGRWCKDCAYVMNNGKEPEIKGDE